MGTFLMRFDKVADSWLTQVGAGEYGLRKEWLKTRGFNGYAR